MLFCFAVAWFVSGVSAKAQLNDDYDRAVAEFRAGKYSSAAALFARVEAAAPRTTDAALYRAKCLVHTLNFGDAEQELHSYLETHQDSSDALYMLGFVLNRENRPSESLVAYTQAAAITKPASDDLKIVGLDYVLLGDYADATKWLKEAVALDSNNADAWYYLGRAYYTKSRLNDARRAFEMILQLDATNARAENNLGLILETEGNATAALTAYRNSIAWQKSKPEKSEQPYVNLGNLLAEQGHPNEAIEPLEEALALAPNNSYCHLTLGILYRKLGKMQQARHELTRATELEPGNATAHYQLGRVYKDMHDLDRAKAEFDRTSELQGRASSPPSHINP